jgi:hypothetical protein
MCTSPAFQIASNSPAPASSTEHEKEKDVVYINQIVDLATDHPTVQLTVAEQNELSRKVDAYSYYQTTDQTNKRDALLLNTFLYHIEYQELFVIPGLGNCGFASIAHQIGLNPLHEEYCGGLHYPMVRVGVIDHMEKNLHHYLTLLDGCKFYVEECNGNSETYFRWVAVWVTHSSHVKHRCEGYMHVGECAFLAVMHKKNSGLAMWNLRQRRTSSTSTLQL